MLTNTISFAEKSGGGAQAVREARPEGETATVQSTLGHKRVPGEPS